LVEQRIENPRVVGSIPTQATKYKSPLSHDSGLFSWRRHEVALGFDPRHRLAFEEIVDLLVAHAGLFLRISIVRKTLSCQSASHRYGDISGFCDRFRTLSIGFT
jgi:hypothetical protein